MPRTMYQHKVTKTLAFILFKQKDFYRVQYYPSGKTSWFKSGDFKRFFEAVT